MVVHRNGDDCQLNNNYLLVCIIAIQHRLRALSDSFVYTGCNCLCVNFLHSVFLQVSICSFIFLQISNINLSFPLVSFTLLLLPLPCCESTLTNDRRLQVYPLVWSPLAEPLSSDRSMTKPVRTAHSYSRLDCIWKTVHHAVSDLKKWPANISWHASISFL